MRDLTYYYNYNMRSHISWCYVHMEWEKEYEAEEVASVLVVMLNCNKRYICSNVTRKGGNDGSCGDVEQEERERCLARQLGGAS